jgi:hypothetical protein
MRESEVKEEISNFLYFHILHNKVKPNTYRVIKNTDSISYVYISKLELVTNVM